MKQYIVLHQSVRNHPGVCAVQAAHAAGEAIRSAPIPATTVVCALMAETSDQLEEFAAVLTDLKIHHVVIREPDPPYFGAATAIGVEPLEDATALSLLRNWTRPFKLLRPEEK